MRHLLEDSFIPLPAELNPANAAFRFGANACITLPVAIENSPTLAIMEELWGLFTAGAGRLSPRFSARMDEHCFAIAPEGNAVWELPALKEGYSYALAASAGYVAARCGSYAGFMQAYATLLQLIRAKNLTPGEEVFSVAGVEIHDKPVTPFRALHLCVLPETTLGALQKYVRLAGLFKFSHIILEFWGMLRYGCLAELSWPHAYSKEQIRPIINEARALGMEVVPMFNQLGHASGSRVRYGRHVALSQNPRLATLFEPDGWTWCISNPKTLELLRSVRGELMELCGPGGYFHIGCDEAYSFATCQTCAGGDIHALLTGYINGLARELKSQGRRAIMWADMLLEKGAWAPPTFASSRPDQKTHEILELLDRDILLADWQYDITSPSIPSSAHLMAAGFDVVPCPWETNANITALGIAAHRINAFGLMPTTWHTLPEHITMLPMAAEACWRGEGMRRDGEVEFMASKMGEFQRKVVPFAGYEQSGWSRREVDT